MVGASEGCPCAAFEIGPKVSTTQYLCERTITLPRLSMQGPETDRARMAEAMAGFLEQA